MTTTDDDRRIATRMKTSLSVTFKVNRGLAKVGVVENISRSGLLLVSTDALLANDTIEVTFADPVHGHSHDVAGDVVRSAPAGRSGVSFVHGTEDALAFVRKMVGFAA